MISFDWARNIAVWYQSPGTEGIRFAKLASVGTISDRPRTADAKHWFWLNELRRYVDEV